jgi:hypothetical protein
MSKCSPSCVFFPIESYVNIEWYYDSLGVKYAKDRPHRCIENGKEIKRFSECPKYKKLSRIYELLD